jgi:outer membrane receptor for ferrienterochelin and colicins
MRILIIQTTAFLFFFHLPAATAQDAFSGIEALDVEVVTGSQFRELLRTTPVRTEVFDAEFIRRSGSRNLAEIAEYSPGVRIDTTCSNCNAQSVQMLGLPQQYIGILQDGLPNFSGLAGVYGIEQIPAGLIGSIEVVKGGGSVLYGPNAVAGVINLLPRDPDVGGTMARFTIGGFTEGDSFGEGPNYSAFFLHDFVSEDQKFKMSLFYNLDHVAPVDLNNDDFTDISRRLNNSGGLRLLWQPSDRNTLSFDYFLSDEERRGGDAGSAFDQNPNTNIIAEEIFSTRHVATLKWDTEFNEKWSGSFAYSYSRTERESYYGGLAAFNDPDGVVGGQPFWLPGRNTGSLGFGDTTDDLHFLNALAFYQPSDQHRLTFGAQYRHETVVDNYEAANRNIDDSFSDLGLLFQHRYKMNESLTLEYGARADFHSNVDDPIFSPRASLLWSISDQFRIRGAFSTGFRAPEIFDEDLHIAAAGNEVAVTTNDPNLVEEYSTTFSISPEWEITDKWRLEGSLFFTALRDTLVVEPVADTDPDDNVLPFLRTNGEDSTILGAELNLGYFSDHWNLQFSWVQQRLEFEDPQDILGTAGDPIDNLIQSSQYTRVPESLGQIRFTHNGRWFDTFVNLKITGPMDIPRINVDPATGDTTSNELRESPWFFNMDVGFRKTFELKNANLLTLDLGVRNLFNDFQDDLQEGAFRDADYIYGPAFPRTIYAGLSYEF